MTKTYILVRPDVRDRAIEAVRSAEQGYVVTISEPRRNDEQNRLMWSYLHDIAGQVEWYGKFLSAENWKDILTASLKRTQVVPGLDGGFVVLGQRTSSMTKRDFSELIDLIAAFGAEKGVKWTEQAA